MKKFLNVLAKPGAGAFDALGGILKATFMLMTAPGRRWLKSENIGAQIGGALWCAFTGYVLPVSFYKMVIGAVFAHDVFFAWLN